MMLVNGIGVPFSRIGGGGGVLPFTIIIDTSLNTGDGFILPIDNVTQDGTIDWGDSSTSDLSYANRSHTYASGGIYTITITAEILKGFRFNGAADRLKLTNIVAWGAMNITNGNKAFQNCSNLNISATDAPTVSTIDFQYIFSNCDAITTPDLSGWDVSGVTKMQESFSYSLLFNGNVSNWVHSSVYHIKRMFRSCPQFNQDLSGWDVSGVTNWEEAFYGCGSFNGSVASWVLQGNMSEAFQYCGSFTGTGVETWNTSAVTSIYRTFSDTAVFNGNVSGWNTGNITNANRAFYNADSFDQDLSAWVVPQMNLHEFMRDSTGLSTANYDALLIAWDAQGAMTWTGTANFGGSKYTSGGTAAAARTSLISKWGGITDGGAA